MNEMSRPVDRNNSDCHMGRYQVLNDMICDRAVGKITRTHALRSNKKKQHSLELKELRWKERKKVNTLGSFVCNRIIRSDQEPI